LENPIKKTSPTLILPLQRRGRMQKGVPRGRIKVGVKPWSFPKCF